MAMLMLAGGGGGGSSSGGDGGGGGSLYRIKIIVVELEVRRYAYRNAAERKRQTDKGVILVSKKKGKGKTKEQVCKSGDGALEYLIRSWRSSIVTESIPEPVTVGVSVPRRRGDLHSNNIGTLGSTTAFKFVVSTTEL
ncbi:hypothetical protein M0804_001027 [Polistes exclamans]|nr:hypothetical protein M0804_001027 [Polistes exclamans]